MSIPAYVQSIGTSEAGAFTSFSKAFTSAQTAGNCNVIAMAVQCATQFKAILPLQITDTRGNTYALVTPLSALYSVQYIMYAVYVAYNISSGINTVTIPFGGTYTNVAVLMVEYSDVTCVRAADGPAGTGFGTTGTAISSGTVTPQGANELIVTYAASTAGGALVPGSGWTSRVNSSIADGLADQLSVAGSAYTGAWTATGSGIWGCITFALAGPPVVMGPPGGLYDQPTVVTLSTSLANASIYYTTNGTKPSTSSTLYTGPFVVATTESVQAFAINSIPINSPVSSYKFNIGANVVPTDPRYEYTLGLPIMAMSGHVMWDPVSTMYYWHGISYGGPGVFVDGFQGAFCYSSVDLLNWSYVSQILPQGTSSQWARLRVVYNATNNNYVLWMNLGFSNQIRCMTSPNPGGPYTTVSTFTSIDGTGAGGDFNLFIDSDGVSCYMLRTSSGATQTIGITKLNASYTNTDGVNQVYYSNNSSSPFGQQSEGHAMAKVGGVYFWMVSGFSIWAPSQNKYTYSTTGILGPWINGGTNPFQSFPGGVPDFTIAFDTQTDQILSIPGRNAYIYIGDRYDTGLTSGQLTALTSNFAAYRSIFLPITFPTSTSAAITWQPAWNFDTVFPTVSGAPSPATFLNYSGGMFAWVNNEPNTANVYLDYSSDSTFSPVTRSENISVNATQLASWIPIVPVAPGSYRIRTVNANGTSVSAPFVNGASVTAQTASSITRTSAVLNGTVDSIGSGNVTQEGFNYGLTAAYGSQVSSTGSFGTGSFSNLITGLAPGQVYHYQAFAVNVTGTGTSSDATFMTVAAASGGGTSTPPVATPPTVIPVGEFPIEASDIGSSLTLYQASLLDYCNPSVKKDQAFVAICQALDPQLKAFLSEIPNCIILSNLSNQTAEVLDFLALYHFNVDYYDTTLPVATKLLLIQNVIHDKIGKGTPQRIIDLMNEVFAFGELIEWFNDNPVGIPNTFRIQIADPLTDPVKVANLVRAILVSKNVRSYFAGISSFQSANFQNWLTVGAAQYDYQILTWPRN